MSTETYNGWKNKQTWALNLWLTNDHDTYLAAVAWANHARTWVMQDDETGGVREFERLARGAWPDFPTMMRIEVEADLSVIDWAAVLEGLVE